MKAFKLLSLTLLMPMLVNAQAKSPTISCESLDVPTTTYKLSPGADKKTIMKVKHFHGTAYAPIHSGVITGSDLGYLKMKADVIAKLGDEFTVTFDQCENFGEALWACSNANKQEINGVKLSGTGFNTRVIESKSYDDVFKSYQVIFNFIYEGMMYEMPMNFSPEECVMK